MIPTLLPGATIGVLGGGQLGRMFALAAHRLGYRVAVYSDAPDSPAGLAVDWHVCAPYDDLERLAAFARQVDVLTFEFENIPAATVEVASQWTQVRPSGTLLLTTQNRLREKRALQGFGIPVADHVAVESAADLEGARDIVRGGALAKTAAWGYDGKGQRRVASVESLAAAFREMGETPLVVEALVPFVREISVVVARGGDGAVVAYEPFENHHEDHVLDWTVWPARISPRTRRAALDVAQAIVTGLDVAGVLCVEMFVLPDGDVVVNELAPRPHNSGHLTIDAHQTSQFEQQVRAVAGLPLGGVDAIAPAAAMANLLGDLWDGGEPDWPAAVRRAGVRLHLYGKSEARPGRKMGHLTAVSASSGIALDRVQSARSALVARASGCANENSGIVDSRKKVLEL